MKKSEVKDETVMDTSARGSYSCLDVCSKPAVSQMIDY